MSGHRRRIGCWNHTPEPNVQVPPLTMKLFMSELVSSSLDCTHAGKTCFFLTAGICNSAKQRLQKAHRLLSKTTWTCDYFWRHEQAQNGKYIFLSFCRFFRLNAHEFYFNFWNMKDWFQVNSWIIYLISLCIILNAQVSLCCCFFASAFIMNRLFNLICTWIWTLNRCGCGPDRENRSHITRWQ